MYDPVQGTVVVVMKPGAVEERILDGLDGAEEPLGVSTMTVVAVTVWPLIV